MIECLGLGHRYEDRLALDDLRLALDPGDALAFIGPNGAGKTTTIRILATLLHPTSGDARVGGHSVVEDPRAVRRLLGFMPDQFGLYDGMRVEEYLHMFAALQGVPHHRRSEVVGQVLDLTEMGDRRASFTESLSKGMRQRLCLAKTLLHDPAVLILDEPASGLDPRARVELKALLRELRSLGKTLFVSSHILPELADFCNKVAVLEKGRMVAFGPLDEVTTAARATRRVRVRVLGSRERAGALLEASPGVLHVADEEGTLVADVSGEVELLADLLDRLVREGLRPVEFHEEPLDLEEVFMTLTRGEAV